MNEGIPGEGIVRVAADDMEREFGRILLKIGCAPEKADACAHIFAENSADGVLTHGVNRFARFVRHIQKGYVDINAEPEFKARTGAIEQWDGRLGPGPLNALICTDRAMQIARESGIGLVALRNTNHWMRGGTYGWRAARAGFLFVGWTNTVANMPAWGAADCRLGNNPLVLGVPFRSEAIVLDMALSQFSFGSLEQRALRNERLPVPGGYDARGELTTDPRAVLESSRMLPMGYWKGSGLALLLDIFATILSGGSSTAEISRRPDEYGLSQVFIAIDTSRLPSQSTIAARVAATIEDVHASVPVADHQAVFYPGERVLRTRGEYRVHGIPVDRVIWKEIQNL